MNNDNNNDYNNNDDDDGVHDNHNRGLGRQCTMCIWHVSYEMTHYEITIPTGPTTHPSH